MTVKELSKILSSFNPEANVHINYRGTLYDIYDLAWQNGEGDDQSEKERNIEKEKLTANSISLYIDKGSEHVNA